VAAPNLSRDVVLALGFRRFYANLIRTDETSSAFVGGVFFVENRPISLYYIFVLRHLVFEIPSNTIAITILRKCDTIRPMKIIGAGFGRTGTMSLKAALNELGFPCYHMDEIVLKPQNLRMWAAIADGAAPDFAKIFEGYEATVDYPVCNYYKELIQLYPEAMVLLSVRDADRWYESTANTIFRTRNLPFFVRHVMPFAKQYEKVTNGLVWDKVFNGRFSSRDHAISVYNDHIADVKATVPPEKLLVYSVKEGWEPLCNFLGVSIPDKPFPNVNSRDQFKRIILVNNILNVLIPVVGLAIIYGMVRLLVGGN